MWKDARFGEVVWFLFEHSITPGKNRTPCLINRALMFNSEAMISTGCRSRSGGKTRQTCREWRFERRSAGGWCPVAPGVLWLVDFVGTVLFTGGILLFVLVLKKIQLYRIPSTLITKPPRAVVLQISNHLVLFENRTSQNLMVYQCLSWFINVYHGLSESVHFQAAIWG